MKVKGLSINDILNIEIDSFNKLNAKDLRQLTSRLVSAGNKRIRAFEKSGVSSPAIAYVQKSGGVFSTRGKNLNELRSEFIRAKTFLTQSTSTIRGYNKVVNETIKTLKKSGVNISPEQFETFWKSYEKLKEINPEISTKQLKYSVLKEIETETTNDSNQSVDDIVETMTNKINELYEQTQGIMTNNVSDFFE